MSGIPGKEILGKLILGPYIDMPEVRDFGYLKFPLSDFTKMSPAKSIKAK